jgi:hypothetical protein
MMGHTWSCNNLQAPEVSGQQAEQPTPWIFGACLANVV